MAALLLLGITLPGQDRLSFTVGAFPDSGISNELSEFLQMERKGQHRKVILDLFNSGCIVCFRMMPKIQELQEQYRSSVRFILVGEEDGVIRKVYEKFRQRFSLSFDVIYDSSFFRYYDIPFVPLYVWLDESGIVKAVTGPDEITADNIEAFVHDRLTFMPFKEAPVTFDDAELLLIGGNGGADTSFLFRSLLSLWNRTQPTIYPARLDYSVHGRFFQALNVSLADLYRYAYFGWARWTCRDSVYGKYYPVPFYLDDDSAAFADVRYNYSFKGLPGDSLQTLLRKALCNDLATYFGYEAMITTRNMPCWKLILLPGAGDQLKSRYKTRSMTGSFAGIDYRHVTVSSVIDLFYFIRQDEYPILNATGIDFPIDISIDAVMTDRESVRKELVKAGLDLVPGEHEIQVLLLKKVPGK